MIYMLHKHKKEEKKQYVHYILYMHNVKHRGLPLFVKQIKKINTKEMNLITEVDLQYMK